MGRGKTSKGWAELDGNKQSEQKSDEDWMGLYANIATQYRSVICSKHILFQSDMCKFMMLCRRNRDNHYIHTVFYHFYYNTWSMCNGV